MAGYTKFTEEEIAEDKIDMLQMFKDGLPMRRIAYELGRPTSYIKRIREKLILEGKISQEEIDEAWKKYQKENPNAQGLDKSKVRKRNDSHKVEERHSKSLQKKDNTLRLLKEGYSRAQVAYELKVTETAVKHYVKLLIDEGKITEEEIVSSSTSRVERLDRTSENYLTLRGQIVSYLKLGYKGHVIRKKLNISTYEFENYVTDIKKRGIMSAQEINDARATKRANDLEFVAEHVKQGDSLTRIRELRPEFSENETIPIINELIEQGIITREQVEANRKRAHVATINQNAQMSAEEQRKFVIERVKQGLTPQEIVDSDETGSLTMHKVLYQKRLIIAEGIVSQEDADLAMKKHKAEVLDEKHSQVMKQIIEYTQFGYTLEEMTEFIGYSVFLISKLRKEYVSKNGWFTKEQMKKFKEDRRSREENERLKMLRKEEEEQKRRERQERQERIAQKRLEEEQKKQEKVELSRKRKLMSQLNSARRKAIKEDEEELDEKAQVQIGARENYLKLLVEAFEADIELKNQDLSLAVNFIYMHPELATKVLLKALISNAYRIGEATEAGRILNELIDALEETPYCEYLRNFRPWIKRVSLEPKIMQLKEEGKTNTEIGEIVGITSAEVSIFLHNGVGIVPDDNGFGNR